MNLSTRIHGFPGTAVVTSSEREYFQSEAVNNIGGQRRTPLSPSPKEYPVVDEMGDEIRATGKMRRTPIVPLIDGRRYQVNGHVA